MHNVEISPNLDAKSKLESELSVLTLTHGDFHAHCNKYENYMYLMDVLFNRMH
jgi:hypothetical protein